MQHNRMDALSRMRERESLVLEISLTRYVLNTQRTIRRASFHKIVFELGPPVENLPFPTRNHTLRLFFRADNTQRRFESVDELSSTQFYQVAFTKSSAAIPLQLIDHLQTSIIFIRSSAKATTMCRLIWGLIMLPVELICWPISCCVCSIMLCRQCAEERHERRARHQSREPPVQREGRNSGERWDSSIRASNEPRRDDHRNGHEMFPPTARLDVSGNARPREGVRRYGNIQTVSAAEEAGVIPLFPNDDGQILDGRQTPDGVRLRDLNDFLYPEPVHTGRERGDRYDSPFEPRHDGHRRQERQATTSDSPDQTAPGQDHQQMLDRDARRLSGATLLEAPHPYSSDGEI